jgi:serine/threonine-protein kinase
LLVCRRGHARWAEPADQGRGAGALPPCSVCGAAVALEPWPAPDAAGGPEPVLPGYRLLRRIEGGAMAAVYQARHVPSRRVVAVKLSLTGTEARRSDRRRIAREAATLRALRHRNVVRLLERGEQDGRPFFVLEWLPGGSLADRLGEGRLPLTDVLRLGQELGRALEYLHEQQVLHLDLRPSNILFTGSQRPRLIDFGLARRLHRPHGLTRGGGPPADPRYQAPEDAAGSKRLGPPADVHALGAILYETLAGRPLFQDLPLRDRLGRMRLTISPPSAFRNGLPTGLDRVCLRCLQPRPERRFPTAATFVEEWAKLVGHGDRDRD